MNNFVVEIFDDEQEYCTLYTVRWLDAEISEAERFLARFRKDAKHEGHLQQLAAFLDLVISKKYGARPEFFRFENQAGALPPRRLRLGVLEPDFRHFPLRWFCMRISDHILILFNGGVKNAARAQDSDLSFHFYEALHFATRIQEALVLGEIMLSSDQSELIFSKEEIL